MSLLFGERDTATMNHIWALHLYEMADGRFKVLIRDVQRDRTVSGTGPTPQHAHRAAECQLVIKPWVCAERPEKSEG